MLSEGERGLLGVGYTPARVIASGRRAAGRGRCRRRRRRRRERARRPTCASCSTRITAGLGVRCRIEVVEDDEAVNATCSGDDLGLLIGRHGQTIDAIQYLANAIAYRAYGDDRKEVVVDAAGYRERRRATLESLAVRSAERGEARPASRSSSSR